jgi:hypothetical protein
MYRRRGRCEATTVRDHGPGVTAVPNETLSSETIGNGVVWNETIGSRETRREGGTTR